MGPFLVNTASGPDHSGPLRFVLELDERTRAQLLGLREIFRRLTTFDSIREDLYGIELFNHFPVQFGRFVVGAALPEEAWVRRSTPLVPIRSDLQTTTVTVHVMSDGLMWEVGVKHVDGSYFSATLSWEMIEGVAVPEAQ